MLKTNFKIIELILILLSLIFAVLNFAILSISGNFVFFSFSTLSLFYLFFTFFVLNDITIQKIFKKESYQEITKMKLFGSIVIGFSFFIMINAIQFKLLDFAGSQILTLFGIFIFIVIGSVALFRFKTLSSFYKGLFKRIIIFLFLGILFVFISNLKIVELKYRNHPNYLKAYKAHKNDIYNYELFIQYQQELAKVKK